MAHAFRVEGAPEIDSDVLGEAIWDDVVLATGFRQNTPDAGQPASDRTEVRIIYTDDMVYFGIVCYVGDPSTIIVSDSRRDSSLADTDSFQIIIDTYLDRQNGFVFGTNPAGLEYDGQVTNEGQGSGRFGGGGFVRRSGSQQQRGSGGGFNVNWDGVWQVGAEISEIGSRERVSLGTLSAAEDDNRVDNVVTLKLYTGSIGSANLVTELAVPSEDVHKLAAPDHITAVAKDAALNGETVTEIVELDQLIVSAHESFSFRKAGLL